MIICGSVVRGIEGMSVNQIDEEIKNGARFVTYHYCISVGFVTFRRTSPIFLVITRLGRIMRGTPYSLISFLLGWYGIPWGIVYTPMCLFINSRGGEDMTRQVLSTLQTLARE
jgi:hypothetical protein